MTQEDLVKKNQKTAAYVFCIVVFMIGLSFASVPLYDLFCRVTGFGGTTQMATDGAGLPDRVETSRLIKVNFNADTSPRLPWEFEADQRSVEIHPGQQALVGFTAQNIGSKPITGTAIFNVTPTIAGGYFYKTQCFCFDRQTLQPGEEMAFPVNLFIDPDIVHDPDLEDVKTITLSYTFFVSDSQELETAQKDF
jgi:cytochrome c oxidase assembly protein subunit 11